MTKFKTIFFLFSFFQFLQSQDFSISFNVSGGSSDYDLTVGFSPDATDEYDSEFDYFAPPAPPPPSFDASLFWNGDRYYTQILAGDGAYNSHIITVQLQYPGSDWGNNIEFNWDNSGWSDFASVELRDAFGGVFLSIDMTEESSIILDNPALSSLELVVAPLEQEESSTDFSVSLNISGGNSDYDFTVGFSPDATDGYDSEFDYFAPPAPPPPSFDAALVWNGDRYYTQILAGDGDITPHEFNIQLQYPEDNSIDINWNNSGWSELGSFELVDPFGGIFISVDMTSQTEISIENPAITNLILVVTPSGSSGQNPFDGNVYPTPMSGIFQGLITINEEPGTGEDWIAAIDSDGNIAGASALLMDSGNSYANLIIYGDDPLTEFDEGMNDGEIFYLKIWNSSTNTTLEYSEPFDCWYNNNGAPLTECGDYNDIYNFGAESEPVPPTASFSADPLEGFAPLEVSFINTTEPGTGYNLFFEWDFGNGDTSNEENPIYTFEYSGTFNITLTATSSDGNDISDVTEIHVVDLPPLAQLVINEIHYNPSSELQGSDNMYEFLEIYNSGSNLVELEGYTITLGIDAVFPDIGQISSGEYIIVAKTPDTYLGNGYQVFAFDGNIYNAGEEIELVDSFGRRVDYVSYDDEGDWPSEADGGGPSLELLDTSFDNELPSSWGPSAGIGGTPGSENSTPIAPSASFSAEPLEGFSPLEVSFTNTTESGTGNELEFEWNFGNGDTSNEENPVYTFESSGDFQVTLTATSSHGTNVSDVTEINVLDSEVEENIIIMVQTLEAYPGDEISLPVMVQFPNEISVNSSDLVFTGFSEFIDIINVDVEGSIPGEEDWTIAYNMVNDSLLVAMAGANSISGAGLLLTLEFLASPEIDNDFIPIYLSSVVFDTGEEIIEVENGGIQILDPISPSASFIAEPTEGILPLTVYFTNTTESGTGNELEFEWNFGNGDTSNEENPVYTFESSGDFQVTLTATSSHGTDVSDVTEINVMEPVPPSASFSADPTVGMFPLNVIFENTSQLGTGLNVEYGWNFGNGDTSNDENPSYTYESPGVYEVTLSVSTTHGEDMSDPTEINVLAIYGDIDMNELVQSYDASLILQYLVDYIELDAIQLVIGDVNLSGELSALDASYVLQYLVGLVDSLPVNESLIASGDLNMVNQYGAPGDLVSIPIMISNNENILSFESVVTFDDSELSFVGIEEMSSNFSFESTESNGIIKIAGATEQDGNTNFELLKLKFILLASESESVSVTMEELRWNEDEINLNPIEGHIYLMASDSHTVFPGWNLVSFDIELVETDPEIVFEDLLIENNLITITGYDENGSNFYDPFGFDFLNTLTSIEPGRGYWARVNEDDQLSHLGIPIDDYYPVNLWSGWGIIGYWLEENSIPQEAFHELIENNNLVYVTGFDDEGFSFYDPNGLEILNTLTEMKNGYGYMLKVNEAVDEFVYPNPSGVMGRKIARNINPNITKTNSCMFINGVVSFDNLSIVNSSKVNIFTESGLLVGEMEVIGGEYLMTGAVYADDPSTAVIDGALIGEKLVFKLNNLQSEPNNVIFNDDMNLYKVDLVFSNTPSEFALIGNYPNPFNPKTTISYALPVNGMVQITVMNILGNEVVTLVNNYQNSGYQTITWDGKDNNNHSVSAGVYFLIVQFAQSEGFGELNSWEHSSTHKMILLK